MVCGKNLEMDEDVPPGEMVEKVVQNMILNMILGAQNAIIFS